MRGRRWLCILALLLAARSSLALEWGAATGPDGCEPPEVFYSAAHNPAVTTPCCPRNPQRCPGGVACVGGLCAAPYDSVPGSPLTAADVPDIIVFLNDDQGWCHYGFMGPGCGTSTTQGQGSRLRDRLRQLRRRHHRLGRAVRLGQPRRPDLHVDPGRVQRRDARLLGELHVGHERVHPIGRTHAT